MSDGTQGDHSDDQEGASSKSAPLSWKGRLVVAAVAFPIVLYLVAYCIQTIGGVYIGWEAVTLRLMQVPAGILLLLALFALALGGFVYGVLSLVRPAARVSWFATLFALIEGGAMLSVLWTFVIPAGITAPVRDIPYLAKPLAGTVLAVGVSEETSYDSDGQSSTSYYLYCVPDDLPGYTGHRQVFRFDIDYGRYDRWRSEFGEADSNATLFIGYSDTADLSGKPTYRVEMLPNTETLISFEPAG